MKILIVDDEVDITEIVEFLVINLFGNDTKTILALSGNEAIKILSENNDIDICISDLNMANGMGTDVLNYLIKEKSPVKFVLCSTVIPAERPLDFPPEYVFSNIEKPYIDKGIKLLFELVNETQATPEKPSRSLESEEYVPVSIYLLSLIPHSPVDIFIRISEDKYIKCLHEKEVFNLADRDKFKSKGIVQLYVKNGNGDPTVNQIVLAAIKEVIYRENIPLEDKMMMTHATLVGIIQFSGMNPELAEASRLNVLASVKLMMADPQITSFWKNLNLLGEYPSKLYCLHSMLSTMLAKKISWNSEAIVTKLSLAAFLQDIWLDSVPMMEICDHRELLLKQSSFTSDEIKKYYEHPTKAAVTAAEIKSLPADVEKILLEQHEMPDGSGFPRNIFATNLGPLSCIFIASGIMARHILRDPKKFDLKIFTNFLEIEGYSKGNFDEVFKIIKNLKN